MKKQLFNTIGNREPISSIIATEIEGAIFSKKFPPGSKIPSEAEFCQLFGVGRTSVREALKSLVAQGLLEAKQGKGVFVKSISTDSLSDNMVKQFEYILKGNYAYDLIIARQIIEPGIAYYAALNRTEDDIALLQKDVDDLVECDSKEIEKLAHFDICFHLHLAEATKNQIMPSLLKPINKLFPTVKRDVLSKIEGGHNAAKMGHKKILKAVIEQDAEKARHEMISHLAIASDQIDEIFKKK
ncbi:MAG: FadR family transcriptional regulator [Bacteroidetes bacterium]|nr:FadR family transcriptional regulator [Bacteroidota bacterium]